jgi:SAM-dependent methyltransferase
MSLASIPPFLWSDEHILMPPALSDSLSQELKARDVFHEACGPSPRDGDLIGGREDEVALKHFTHRFTTSSARVEYVVLNPHRHFDPTSADLLTFFQDGRVSVLDIPCGSGGGLLGMLCSLGELRRHHALPRLPVDLHVLGADISPGAMAIHKAMLGRLKPGLTDVGIRVIEGYSEWDVTDDYSTSRLMDTWLRQAGVCEAYLVFVSAFGGFAQDHLPNVQTAIRDILVRFHDDRQLLVAWIEPAMKANRKWFPPLTEMLYRLFRGRGETRGHSTEVQFRWRHPFTEESIPGSVQVISCDRLG